MASGLIFGALGGALSWLLLTVTPLPKTPEAEVRVVRMVGKGFAGLAALLLAAAAIVAMA